MILEINIPIQFDKIEKEVTFYGKMFVMNYDSRGISKVVEVDEITFSDFNLEENETDLCRKYLEDNYYDIEQQFITEYHDGE